MVVRALPRTEVVSLAPAQHTERLILVHTQAFFIVVDVVAMWEEMKTNEVTANYCFVVM